MYPCPFPEPFPVADESGAYERVVLAGGTGSLTLHRWTPVKGRERIVLLLLHGIGMHGEPYASVAPAFTRHGITLVVPDLRGHGRSEGPRGRLAPVGDLRSDFDRIMLHLNRQHPGRPLFLAGESMGGLLAADYASVRPHSVEGLILLCPGFRAHPSRFILRGFSTLLLGRINISSRAHMEPSTRIPEFVRARTDDPHVTQTVYPSYLWRLATLGMRWPSAARNITVPVQLHLPGSDRIIDDGPSRKVFKCLGTSAAQRSLVEWPDAYHTLFWDPETPAVIESMVSWLSDQNRS